MTHCEVIALVSQAPVSLKINVMTFSKSHDGGLLFVIQSICTILVAIHAATSLDL